MNTGKRVQCIRKEKGISQFELANKVKILNQSQISKIEKGYRKITDIDLLKLSEALEVSLEQLLQ